VFFGVAPPPPPRAQQGIVSEAVHSPLLPLLHFITFITLLLHLYSIDESSGLWSHGHI
jgi:hypothetical protein